MINRRKLVRAKKREKGGYPMKSIKFIILMISLLIPISSFASPLGHLRISLIEGDVQIYTEDTEDWVPASINMPLRASDRIWVPDRGRAEIQMRDGTVLRLDEKTGLDLLSVDKDSLQVYLSEGRAYANFRGVSGSILQIDTPSSSIRAYQRAVFRIDTFRYGEVELSVFEGYVYAENSEGSTRVDEGSTLFIREGYPGELTSLYPPDEWENWNRNRDRRYVDRRPPSHYLPEELHGYSNDFDEYGRWVHVREYGYVWTPRLVISTGWAPYRIGRWVWIGGDYVWVSYEPWGWVPYHYGRWVFVSKIGWCWVPPVRGAVYWGPGFVGWVYTPTYISWVPLGPGEIYYGYGYFGPHSVNIANINRMNIWIERVVYRNIYVPNAVTVVHHDTFIHGRYVDVKVSGNPFLKERIHVGRPIIKPEFQTKIPMMKEIYPDRRPPESIRRIEIRVLKETRLFSREREYSIFRKETRPMEMPVRRGEERLRRREAERGMERRSPEPQTMKVEEPKTLRKEPERDQVKRPVSEVEKSKSEGSARSKVERLSGRQIPEKQVESPSKTEPIRTEPVRAQERKGEVGGPQQEKGPVEKAMRRPGEAQPERKISPQQGRLGQPEKETRREAPKVEEKQWESPIEGTQERGKGNLGSESKPNGRGPRK